MPSLNLAIAPLGPLIDVVIGVSAPREAALVSAQQQVPAPVPCRILIDTGASCTCIDASIIKQLGITPSGVVDIHTPSTQGKTAQKLQYDVRFTIPHPSLSRVFHAIPVIESDFTAQGIQGLLGRDILAHCYFAYNGEIGFYTLCL